MSATTAIAVYFIIWWLTLFVVLPWGVRSQHESGAISPGTEPGAPIRYLTGDYRDQAGGGWDFVVSSLVTHHMTPQEIMDFLRFMETEARVGWMINDLLRHRFAYHGFPLLARIMGWHRIVREDGQLSIARSFRPAEWRALLGDAGLADSGAQVVRRFSFRLCVERIR